MESSLAFEVPARCIGRSPELCTRRIVMHDLLIALAFIGMVILPAIVASNINVEAIDDSK